METPRSSWHTPPTAMTATLPCTKSAAASSGTTRLPVEDIEGLGGTRELCVYKHGFDGIEAIRDFANRTAVCKFDERVVVRDPIGAMPDLGPTLRNTAVLDEWDARLAMQQPRDPQGIAAAALTAAEGGTKAVAEHGGNKH